MPALTWVGAVVALKVEDYDPQEYNRWLRLHEKDGKLSEMPCQHNLEEHLDAYIQAASIGPDRKPLLFRAASRKAKEVADGPMSRADAWPMIRRRASDACIETAMGHHTFRATGITDHLTNGGRTEVTQRMDGHSNAKMTGTYDRRNDDVSLDEVERIAI